MTLEYSILYYLATLTVVLKSVLVKLLACQGEISHDPLVIASRERAVYNAVRAMIQKDEIAEETVSIKRKGKKPLKVDYLRITGHGISRLKDHGGKYIPWSSFLRTDIRQIIGSGHTKEDIATRFCLISSAAMMALAAGSQEITLSPTESIGKQSLSEAVQNAMQRYKQETDEYIEDVAEESEFDAPLYVPAINMKRELAVHNGIAADNEKRSGQSTGAFFLHDRIIITYTALPHTQPS